MVSPSEKFIKSIPLQMGSICIVQLLGAIFVIGFYLFFFHAFQKQEDVEFRFEQNLPVIREHLAREQDIVKLRDWTERSLTIEEADVQLNRSNRHVVFSLMKGLGFEFLFSAFAFGLFAYRLKSGQTDLPASPS